MSGLDKQTADTASSLYSHDANLPDCKQQLSKDCCDALAGSITKTSEKMNSDRALTLDHTSQSYFVAVKIINHLHTAFTKFYVSASHF